MTISQLKAIVAIVEFGSLNKAAETLFISQPALSTSLAKLEKELQTTLFERKNNRLTITPAGESFFMTAQTVLNLLDECSKENSNERPELSGELSIAGFSTLTPIIPSVCRFLSRYPNVTINLYSGSNNLFRKECSEFDFVLCTRENHVELAIFQRLLLYPAEYVLAVNKNHKLSNKEHVKLCDLAEENWTFVSIIKPTFEPSYYHCLLAGLVPKVKIISNNAYMKFEVIASGAAIGIVPKADAEIFSMNGQINTLSFSPPFNESNGYYLCWDATGPMNDLKLAFFNHVQEEKFQSKNRIEE